MYLRKTGNIFGDEQSGYNKYISEVVMYSEYYKKILDSVHNLPDTVLKNHIKKTELSENTRKSRPFICAGLDLS